MTARLTFTTTAKVDVILSAGGQVDRKSEGPGNVSMTTSGRGAEICFGRDRRPDRRADPRLLTERFRSAACLS